MSSGLIPNLLKGAGDVVGDIVGGLQRGEKLSPDLVVGALGRGAASTLGRVLAPKPQSEQAIRIMAPVGNSAANARPIMMPSSSGGDRVVMQESAAAPSDRAAAVKAMEQAKDYEGLARYWKAHHDSADPDLQKTARRAMGSLIDDIGRPGIKWGHQMADYVLSGGGGGGGAEKKKKKPKKFRNYYPKDAEAPSRKR